MKKIIDIFGRELEVDDSRARLVWYSNKDGKARYNAPIVDEDDDKHEFFTDYYDNETLISDLETKLQSEHSPVLALYARKVDYHAGKNDPDNEIWSELVEYIENNESKFFDEYGDMLSFTQIRNELLKAELV